MQPAFALIVRLTFSPSHLLTFSPSHLLTFSPRPSSTANNSAPGVKLRAKSARNNTHVLGPMGTRGRGVRYAMKQGFGSVKPTPIKELGGALRTRCLSGLGVRHDVRWMWGARREPRRGAGKDGGWRRRRRRGREVGPFEVGERDGAWIRRWPVLA